MPDEEVLQGLVDKELDALSLLLLTRAEKSALTIEEFIQLRLSQGVSLDVIRQNLINDLETGGRMFGEFRNNIKATANGTIHRFRDTGQVSEHGIDQTFKWAAVLVKTCPDCEALHGTDMTWEEWERTGLPRVRDTICRDHCRCMLIPSRMTVLQRENIQPIRRSKGRG